MINSTDKNQTFKQLTAIMEKMPVGITIIDDQNRMLFYNRQSTKIVDRKPEYIGKPIESCHQQSQSIEQIKKMLSDLRTGKIDTAYYESERNGKRIGVTVFPFDFSDGTSGFIQVIVDKS